MKKKLTFGAMILVLVFSAAIWGIPNAYAAKELHVGCTFGLTGVFSGWGIPIKRGLEIYIEDLNARGGIKAGGETYKVVGHMYDNSGHTPPGELAAFQKAILQDKCVVMFSTPQRSMNVVAGAFASEQKVLNFTWGMSMATSPDRPFTFGAASTWPEFQAVKTHFLIKKYNKKRFAVINPDANFGVQDNAWNVIGAKAAGAEVVFTDLYPMDMIDFTPVIKKMLATKPDIISLGASGVQTIPTILETCRTLGYKGIFSTWALNVPSIYAKVPADYVDGLVHMSQPDMREAKWVGDWVARLYAKHESKWPGEWTGDGTDTWTGGALWEAGVKLANSVDPDKIRHALQNTQPVNVPGFNFGDLYLSGKELFGRSGAFMTPWFVGVIKGGKTEIVGSPSMHDFYKNNTSLIVDVVNEYKLLQ
jgi:branched-chain amino acid transport system substrate-binding protein